MKEYKVIYKKNGINFNTLEEELNQLGKDGWTLVTQDHLCFIFIREKIV